ncbi:hypothetical protein EI693_03980 [Pseudomonas oryziphila]|uniref:Uncharacterized protein n=1 Tax=Pseudomonas oryziphila TaxID=2894079 RepID=A0ABM7CLJ9_9PSED|nr:hypothetical protein EI693_03980 [Pseudomonas oryziphila]
MQPAASGAGARPPRLSPPCSEPGNCRSGLVPRKARKAGPGFQTEIAGAATQPFRGTRPLLQGTVTLWPGAPPVHTAPGR